MNPIELSLFAARLTAICDEMGTVLRRTAFSPNIKDRLDFSCAVFDDQGELCAQAAHIPVHLGSMAYAMAALVREIPWQAGDLLAVNDPFLGGTHLPDVTLVEPVFAAEGELAGFVANRAHHADIGCDSPGSMPISTRLEQEGRIIPPTLLLRGGQLQADSLALLTGHDAGRLTGDFAAQASANRVGRQRLQVLVARHGLAGFRAGLAALNDYGERLARRAVERLRPGQYRFTDYLDDDGIGTAPVPLHLVLSIADGEVVLDFSECPDQVPGNLNCPLPVTAAAAYYAMRCLMDPQTPACAGTFRPVHLRTRPGSIVDARRPAAVAAGNVETSTRLVDVILGGLAEALPERIPAASQGSMNNIAMGRIDPRSGRRWDYYETLGGGMGGGPSRAGLSGVHSHMTNTLNTPVESVEMHYPLRVLRYQLRSGSGGPGRHPGGDGLVREYEFLEPARVSLITERRRLAPWGLAGGGPGARGENLLNGAPLPGKCQLEVQAGDRLEIRTPGGGGHGADTAVADV
jgi:N-methylhydantoinase B